MQILHQDEKRLSFQDWPWASLGLGLLYGLGGGAGILVQISQVITTGQWLALLPMLVLLGIGGVTIFRSEVLICHCDRQTHTLTLRRQGIRRMRQMQCHLQQICWIELYGRTYRYNKRYRVRLLLRSGKAVSLTQNTGNHAQTWKMAHTLADFFHLPCRENVEGLAALSWLNELFGEIH